MGALDVLLSEEQKKKKPSQIAAEQNQATQSGSALDSLLAEAKKPKPVVTTPTVTPPVKPIVQPTVKPTQPQQPTNFLTQAIDAIKKTAMTAIDALTKSPQQQDIISPVAKQDQVTTPGAVNPTMSVNVNNPTNVNTKLTLDSTQPSSSATTTQSLNQQKQIVNNVNNFTAPVRNVIDTFASTINQNLTEIATKGVVSTQNQVMPRSEYLNQTEYQKAVDKFKNRSLADAVNKDFGLGISGIIQGASGGVLKPTITASNAPKTIDEKISQAVGQTLGTVWALKKITNQFNNIAKGSTTIGDFLDKYPKLGKYVVSYATNILGMDLYGQINPDTKNRFLQLAKDTAAGTVFSALGGVKNGAISVPLNFAAGVGLAKAQGASNEDAFISGGILSVLDAGTRGSQALVKSKFKSDTMKMTPEELLNQANSTNFQGTPASDVLKKAARAASAQGKDVQIDLNVAQRSRVAKAFNAKTPEGVSFSVSLVDKNPIVLLSEQGKTQTATPQDVTAPTAPINGVPDNLPPVIANEFNKGTSDIRVPDTFKSPEEQAAFKTITDNPQTFIDKYKQDFQNEVNPDLALKMFPDYQGHNADTFSRITGAIKTIVYNDLLTSEKGTKNNTVLFTAGAPGVGKSSSINIDRPLREKYSIVFDTTFSNKSAPEDFQKALDNGYKAELNYTFADPSQTWSNGTLPRVSKEGPNKGRVVTEGYFLNAHDGAFKNVIDIYNKNKDNPNAILNFYKRDGSTVKPASIDEVKKFIYNTNQAVTNITSATNKAYEQKQITKQHYEAIIKDRTQLQSGRAAQPTNDVKNVPVNKSVSKEKVTPSLSLRDSLIKENRKVLRALKDVKEGKITNDQYLKISREAKIRKEELVKGSTTLPSSKEKAPSQPQKVEKTKRVVREGSGGNNAVIDRLRHFTGDVFTYQKPVESLWKSQGNTVFIRLKPNMGWSLNKLKYSKFVESAQEAGGNNVLKVVLKEPDIKVINPKPPKRPAFNSKEARAIQGAFGDKLEKIQRTATDLNQLVTQSTKLIDTAITSANDNKIVLAGIRTAINKEMFAFVGTNSNHKARFAELQTMLLDPDIGPHLENLQNYIEKIDEMLMSGGNQTGGVYASIGNYADIPNQTRAEDTAKTIEFPELVQIAKELIGKVPQVGGSRRFKPVRPGQEILGGFFKTGPGANVFLNPELFKNPTLLAKILSHELGHLVDYLPEKTMSRGNLLGRIASLNKYMKTMLKETPDSEFELITPKERAKIRAEAKKGLKNNYETITREIVTGTEPTNPEEILSIWRDATGGIKNPELNSYIAGLSDERKKEIVVAAMRSKIPDWVTFVKTIKKTITEKVLKNAPSDVKALYKKMLREEILKRKLFDLETIKRELNMLSMKWRPYNPNTSSVEFNKYRNSSPELYADAISVMFNDPVMLKNEAPNFWRAFFNYADQKPEVQNAIFATWDLLNKGEEAVFTERQKNVEQMFDNTEQKFTAINLEKAKQKTNLVYTLKLLFNNKNEPIIRKVNQARKAGKTIDSSLNPVYAYEGLNYMDGKLEDFVQTNFQPIFEKAQSISPDGWVKLGSVLLYERSIMERGDMANPLGFDPKTAQDQLNGLEKSMTPQQWTNLQDTLKLFRRATNKIVSLAEDNGFYTPELIKQMKANPAYATYQVIDYLDTYISAHVSKSIGTLKDISNPATASIMKGISVVKAIERNNAKNMFVEFQKTQFPDEIPQAKSVFKGKRMEFLESKDPNLKMIRVIKDGKMQAYYVEKDLANTINGQTNDTIVKTAKIARLLTGAGIYRPLFTSLNLGFSTFNFVRDFQRYWTNVPDYTLGAALTSFPRAMYRYAQAVPASIARVNNTPNRTITEMKNLNILGATYNGVFEHNEVNPEDQQIERIMKSYGLMGQDKHRKIFTSIFKVLDSIDGFNNFIETLPKVAGYNELKGQTHMTPEQMADFIRTKIGSPNFRVSGQLTPITNSILLFSNAIKEGIKSDFQIATGKAGKHSAGGFWWKTISASLLPKMLMMAAALGLLGKWLEDRMKDVSEYDKTNFTIIPTGVDSDGKTVYLRVPQSESQRFISGLLWKVMRNATRKDLKLEDVFDVASYGAGQLPNITPLWMGIGSTISYLSGNNPYDIFRNRNIIPDTTFKAGFKYSLPVFVDWLSKNQGAGIMLPSYVPTDPTKLQQALAYPFISNMVGRWIKSSDYGQTEANKRVQTNIDQQKAQKSIETKAKLDTAIKQFNNGNKSNDSKILILRQLVKDVVGPLNSVDARTQRTNLIKKFNIGLIKGSADALTGSVIDATSNDAKAQIILSARDSLGTGYNDFVKNLYRNKVISINVLTALRKKK